MPVAGIPYSIVAEFDTRWTCPDVIYPSVISTYQYPSVISIYQIQGSYSYYTVYYAVTYYVSLMDISD